MRPTNPKSAGGRARAALAMARDGRRAGTIYVVVLFASLMVATIGLASVQLLRLQGRTADDSTDFVEARTYARAALEVGMLKIRNDPYWRTNQGNGAWYTDKAIGNGTFTLLAADPIDGDVTNGDNHPVVLTGIGKKGEATFQTSVRMEVGPRNGSCLEVAMIAGEDLSIAGAVLNSDHPVSANDDIWASSGAVVQADVEAADMISGGTFNGAKLANAPVRTMPDPDRVFDKYLELGTVIPYSSLPRLRLLNLIDNPGLETNLAGWSAQGACDLVRNSSNPRSGSFSLQVTNRANSLSGAVYNLEPLSVSRFVSGHSYSLTVPFFPTATGNYSVVVAITTPAGSTLYTLGTTNINVVTVNRWRTISATFTPSFSGLATSVSIRLVTPSASSYFLDDLSLTDTFYPSDSWHLDRVLLSPASNPFGATNPRGIYVINCGFNDVVVQNCRIVGTLVFLDPGTDSYIQEAIVWEPAVYNYPAFLSNASIRISPTAAAPSESALAFNMNPPGTPYPYQGGTSNTTLTDAYPAQISGLIYSKNRLRFYGTTNVAGVVIAAGNIEQNGGSLSLSFRSIYLNDPPPGFDVAAIAMKVVPGSWKRAVEP